MTSVVQHLETAAALFYATPPDRRDTPEDAANTWEDCLAAASYHLRINEEKTFDPESTVR